MGRPRKEPEPPRLATGPKCYPVVVPNADEQRAFEALAEHQHRADVGAWLHALGSLYVSLYFVKTTERPKALVPWIKEVDACK